MGRPERTSGRAATDGTPLRGFAVLTPDALAIGMWRAGRKGWVSDRVLPENGRPAVDSSPGAIGTIHESPVSKGCKTHYRSSRSGDHPTRPFSALDTRPSYEERAPRLRAFSAAYAFLRGA